MKEDDLTYLKLSSRIIKQLGGDTCD